MLYVPNRSSASGDGRISAFSLASCMMLFVPCPSHLNSPLRLPILSAPQKPKTDHLCLHGIASSSYCGTACTAFPRSASWTNLQLGENYFFSLLFIKARPVTSMEIMCCL